MRTVNNLLSGVLLCGRTAAAAAAVTVCWHQGAGSFSNTLFDWLKSAFDHFLLLLLLLLLVAASAVCWHQGACSHGSCQHHLQLLPVHLPGTADRSNQVQHWQQQQQQQQSKKAG
jgi:hypothetical protein